MNSAGIGGFARSEEEDPARWAAIIAVNLTGTFLMCRYTLPHLLDGGGAIVNIASNAGIMGQPFSAAYCASKGGVVNLTRALAVEYLDRGVRVNCVAPGGMRTPLTKGFRLPGGRGRRRAAPGDVDASACRSRKRSRTASRTSRRTTRAT